MTTQFVATALAFAGAGALIESGLWPIGIWFATGAAGSFLGGRKMLKAPKPVASYMRSHPLQCRVVGGLWALTGTAGIVVGALTATSFLAVGLLAAGTAKICNGIGILMATNDVKRSEGRGPLA